MKSLLTISCLLALCACSQKDNSNPPVSNGETADRGAQAPVIKMSEGHSSSSFNPSIKSIELGSVYQHNQFPLEFPFTIDGEDGIVIDRLTTSCGCTDARLEVEGQAWEFGVEIPGGSKGIVHAIFDSKDYNGTKTSSITVDGNSPSLPTRLNLAAQVQPVFGVTPHMARFAGILAGELRRNPNPKRTLEVLGSQPWEITEWLDLPDWVTIRDSGEKTVAEDGIGEVHQLIVSLDPDIAEGRHSALAVAQTDIGHKLTFQVYAELYGKVRYFPDRLVGFNLVEKGDDPERRLQINASVDWLNLPMPAVTYEGSEVFDVILDEKTAEKEFVVIVQVKADAEIGRHAGKVLVTWPDDADIPNREFPISVLIREPR